MFETVETGIKPSAAPLSGTGRHGRSLWSAQIPKDPETGAIVTGDIAVQTRRVLENLRMALAAAGGSLADLCCVNISLIDAADAPGMNAVWREMLRPPFPVRTTVVVAGLLSPGARIEICAQAIVAGQAAEAS